MKQKKLNFFKNSLYVQAIRQGLTLAVPFLLVGSFALMLNSLPWEAYQEVLKTVWSGKFSAGLVSIYDFTLGSLALILILTISYSIGRLSDNEGAILYPITALCSYLGFTNGIQGNEAYIFGADWVFTAMCITLFSCVLLRLGERLNGKLKNLHTIGADYIFNQVIRMMFPCIFIFLIFVIAGKMIPSYGGDNNLTNFGSYLFLKIFEMLGSNIFTVLLYVFFTHFLWFFGVHGTNTLDAVSTIMLEAGVDINQSLVAQHLLPTEIFSKTFLDVFVFIGGCGSALCLILALFFASKKSHNRRIAQFACFPVLFNISELIVFGFPIIFNPVMLIPFIGTPIALTLISSAAMKLGVVPLVVQSVEWTSPVLLSGWQATGAFAGSLLQVLNIAVGTLIYLPFVRMSEKRQADAFSGAVRRMEQELYQAREAGVEPTYFSNSYPLKYEAKTLAEDLHTAMIRGHLELYYQLQVDNEQKPYGAEALLRWNHPIVGYISPELLIVLATQSGYMQELGKYILKRGWENAREIDELCKAPISISINLSPRQMEDKDFLPYIRLLKEEMPLKYVHIVLEITEQSLLNTSNLIRERIHSLQEMNIGISIDDFGMGHSSMMYLQDTHFDELKLDGCLVRQLQINERTKDIVKGILQMAESLNFRVVAEYVETQELQEILKELGCHIYQGYLYSKPVPLSECMLLLDLKHTLGLILHV